MLWYRISGPNLPILPIYIDEIEIENKKEVVCLVFHVPKVYFRLRFK